MNTVNENANVGKGSFEEKNKVKAAQSVWTGMPIGMDRRTPDEVRSQIANWLPVLVAEDQVVELRAIKVDSFHLKGTCSGFFDSQNLDKMAAEAAGLTAQAEGVYFTLNPLDPALLARRYNRVDSGQDGCGCDKDVLRRRWLLVDADPVRLSGVSSTDEERAKTKEVVFGLRAHLTAAGWPAPVVADSGNGYHLLYRVDLPSEDKGLVKRVLAALASRFDTAEVKVDQKVFNPARIVKLYGTLARKGDSTPERPHRWSAVLEVPEPVKVVQTSLLEALAAEAPAEPALRPAAVSRPGSLAQPTTADREARMNRARAYLKKVDPAVAGSSGHNQAFNVACKLACGFALPVEDALEVMRPWNERCSPPWSEKELRHKLQDASKQPGEKGYLLGEGGQRNDTKPGSGEAAGSENGKVTAERAEDDPSRLAGVVLDSRFVVEGKVVLRFWQQGWWRWDEGAYQPLSEDELRAGVWKVLDEEFGRLSSERASRQLEGQKGKKPPAPQRSVNRNMVANVLEALKSRAIIASAVEVSSWLDPEQARLHGPVVVLKNGLLRLKEITTDGEAGLLPLTPEWFGMARLRYEYDPKAECPKWRAFLEKNLEGDQERMSLLQEWFGYCLMPDTSRQRFLMLEGEGANGKSVVCAALTALLGEANVSNVPLEKFDDRFSLTRTLGKLANIASEIGEIDKAAEGYLKSFTGGDRMQFERKGIDPIEATPTARLVFATNNHPRFVDRSEGIWRRMLLIPFRVTISDAERVPGMDRAGFWVASGELAGMFNWAREGLRRLESQGRFTTPSVSKEALDDYRTECNPARSFLQEHYEASTDPTKSAAVQTVYELYRAWCGKDGYQPLCERVFGREVKRVFNVERKRASSGRRQYTYGGIKAKPQVLDLQIWVTARQAAAGNRGV